MMPGGRAREMFAKSREHTDTVGAERMAGVRDMSRVVVGPT